MTAILTHGNALHMYETWAKPTMIFSDGAYGINGFEGDAKTPDDLREWYEPHVRGWTQFSDSATTLWFCNTEIGWASTHPLLATHGWIYRGCNTWNKGTGHVAGNVNTGTIRRFPVATEVCVQYVRDPAVTHNGTRVRVQDWMRAEWKRAGMRLHDADVACGTKNAASRKYLASDDLWYCPSDAFETLVKYANEHGEQSGKPYFSLDGKKPVSSAEIERLRYKFTCPFGVTNVWDHATVRGDERVKVDGKIVHANQKPIALVERMILASTDVGDVVWEPFGGLFTAALVAKRVKRYAYGAETNPFFFDAGKARVERG